MDDLIQTLERMQIKPIGRESANRSFSEHRVISPCRRYIRSETAATHETGQSPSLPCELNWMPPRMTRKRNIDWLQAIASSFDISMRSHRGRNFSQ